MSKRTYWKTIRKALTGSKGRFISIMLLMMLGSFAFVGLKSTAPDMRKTASDYLDRYHTMDMAVMADYGLSKEDQKELSSLKGARVEYGYVSDVTLEKNADAVRIFSYDSTMYLSKYELTSGNFPKKADDIALSDAYKGSYKIGDKVTFETGEDSSLKTAAYTVTGFVNSSEILSKTSLGSSTAGDGSLSGYALVLPQAFDSDVYGIARIAYEDLSGLTPFQKTYKERLSEHQKDLDKLLADNGSARLASLRSDAQKDIAAAQAQVDSAKTQLDQAAKQYQSMRSYLTASQEQDYLSQKAASESQIREAESSISAAQRELDSLTKPKYSSYTRSTFPGGEGYNTFATSIDSISVVADWFPLVLYLVAAMVTFTTMTRFVDEERQNSGILKALGYSDADVIRKFVLYGFAAGFLGTLIGAVAGTYYLPYRVGNITMNGLTLDDIKLVPYASYILSAFVLAAVSSVLPAFWIAGRELKDQPALLLLPKPPVSGSQIFLERLTFFWRRLSFTHKVTVRNIFRYKQRMLMTVFGVAGSVGLLFAGLGLQSSISEVVDNQFGRILAYDILAIQDNKASSDEKEAVKKALSTDDFSDSLHVAYMSDQQTIKNVTEAQTVTTLISPKKDFSGLINLTSVRGGPLSLSDQGVVISEKLADLYHVKTGDYFDYIDNDNHQVSLKVSGIAKIYTGHFIFMTQAYYKKTFEDELPLNAYLLKTKDDSDGNVKKLSAALLDLEGIRGLSQNIAMTNTLEKVVGSISSVMLILIVVSILIALVILYNLTTINIAERIRELSTIKVLGFHSKEVTMYIYRETITLSIVGIVVGLVGGYGLYRFLVSQMGGDQVVFEKSVDSYVYAVPVLVIVLILAALGWLVNHRLKTIDMLEALKSLD